MATRRKKQYMVAGILLLAVGMACVLPLPTREPGTLPTDATTLTVGAERVISPMPSDPTRLNAVVCDSECQ